MQIDVHIAIIPVLAHLFLSFYIKIFGPISLKMALSNQICNKIQTDTGICTTIPARPTRKLGQRFFGCSRCT